MNSNTHRQCYAICAIFTLVTAANAVPITYEASPSGSASHHSGINWNVESRQLLAAPNHNHTSTAPAAYCHYDPANPTWALAKTTNAVGWAAGDRCVTPALTVVPYGGAQCIGGGSMSACLAACKSAGVMCTAGTTNTGHPETQCLFENYFNWGSFAGWLLIHLFFFVWNIGTAMISPWMVFLAILKNLYNLLTKPRDECKTELHPALMGCFCPHWLVGLMPLFWSIGQLQDGTCLVDATLTIVFCIGIPYALHSFMYLVAGAEMYDDDNNTEPAAEATDAERDSVTAGIKDDLCTICKMRPPCAHIEHDPQEATELRLRVDELQTQIETMQREMSPRHCSSWDIRENSHMLDAVAKDCEETVIEEHPDVPPAYEVVPLHDEVRPSL